MSKKVKRLFEGFQPTNYKITLDPNRDSMKISGTVSIRGKKVGRPSQRLTFHQNGLTITSATVIKHDKKNGEEACDISRINHQRTLDEVRLHADHLIYPGEYTVTMEFTGDITRPMDGVYPCFFKHDGKDKQLIATQFESHFARQAFPCIDEPEAKATFDLTLTSPVGETVLANTPVADQKTEGDKLITTFETTPVMSTYLLAFIYGELEHKEATTKNGTLVRTFATPDNIAHTEFALEVAVRCLEHFEDYFAIPFPLPKCDFVALPDFAAGAMENWGLITFREHALLVDPENTSLPSKQYVAEVICHELTHQWFGNLVTMRWWTDLWLNEGFANVMAYIATDKLFPEWKMMTNYIIEEQQTGLKLDALENTHPIEVSVQHPDEIRTIFDAISYNKGGSSIMMLSHYLGEKDFRDGLRHYLKQHAYGNTDTVDLWDALETVSKKPVKQMMAAWTSQAGYPVVRTTVDGNEVTLEQEQFFVNPLARKEAHDKQLWPIALNAGSELPDILDREKVHCTVSDGKAVKVNQGQNSFIRVIYDPAHVRLLAERVKKNDLEPLDRLGVLSDAFEAAKAGYSDTVSALELMEAYKHEDNDAVWDVMVGAFAAIRNIMDDEDLREAMKPYGRSLVHEQLERLGVEAKDSDSHFDRLLRPTILGVAASCDEESVVSYIEDQFQKMTKSEDIDPDMRGIIYTTIARRGDAADFDKLLELHNTSTSPEERVTIAAALTNFRQPELIERALSLITTDTVRLQDVAYWIAYSFGNRFARQATWEWVKEHWQWLKENLGSDTSFTRMPAYVARSMSRADFLPEYKQFFESVMEPSIDRAYKQGIEMIQWQSEWRNRDLASIKQFFETHK